MSRFDVSDIQSVDMECYKSFKHKVHKQYMNSWNQAVNNVNLNPILRTYVTFKNDFRLEAYLFNINDYHL